MTTSIHIFFVVLTVTWIAFGRLPKWTVQMRHVDVSCRSFEKVTVVLRMYICDTAYCRHVDDMNHVTPKESLMRMPLSHVADTDASSHGRTFE